MAARINRDSNRGPEKRLMRWSSWQCRVQDCVAAWLTLVFAALGSVVAIQAQVAGDEPANPTAATRAEQTTSNSKGKTAFVSVPRALIYSGPAEEFYPTDQLKQGTAVEIFHRTDSGWAAIRPPKGSFSWIPASEAFLLPGGRAAEVTSDNSVSWIGTALGTAKQYRWQVRLNKGEQLIILGEEVIKDEEGRETLWYRIAPPSGEFRWIQTGVIESEPPAIVAEQKGERLTSDVVPASTTDDKVPHDRKKGETQGKSTSKEESDAVQTAQYGGIVVHEDEDVVMLDGQVIDGGVYYNGGDYYDDSHFDGMHFEGGYIVDAGEVVEPDASWNDWQLFEFTDEGLRFPLWERALAKRAHQHDPLQHDPFSLAMAPKNKGPRLRSVMHENPHVEPRGRTPWRDPRNLAQQRMQGYPQASSERGRGTTLSSLREAFNPSESNQFSDRFEMPGPENRFIAPDSRNNWDLPREAPSLNTDQSLMGFGAVGSLASGAAQTQLHGQNSIDGNWLSRNWFGFSQQEATSGMSAFDSGNAALIQLQLKLNELVTQPMMQWNFGAIKGQVQQLIQGGQSPVERGQARLLLERIEAFEQLAMRSGYVLAGYSGAGATAGNSSFNSSYSANGLSMPPNPPPNPPVITASYVAPNRDDFSASSHSAGAPYANTPNATANSASSSAGNGSLPFDATGWLVPVHAATAGQPTHAITDDSGRIVAYVTGLPGMNLDRYINQAIGIHGLRGFLPQFQAAHIEAQNVVRLR